MLDVRPHELEIVRSVLAQWVPRAEVRAFGSRARGTAKPYSDLDLAVVGLGPLPIRTLAELTDAFQSSALPFRVDIVDWNQITDDFRALIAEESVVLQPAQEWST